MKISNIKYGISVHCVVFCLLLISCNSATNKNEKEQPSLTENKDVIVIDIDNIEKDKVSYLSDYLKDVRPIVLETKEESMIGMISKLIVCDDLLFILDKSFAKSLFVFDKNGKFIRKIGNKGAGPGEYAVIFDFTIDMDNKVVYIMDGREQRIIWYDMASGKYINSVKIKDDYVRSYTIQYIDGKIYADAYFITDSEDNFLLRTLNLSTGEQESCWLNSSACNKGWNEYVGLPNTFISNNSKNSKYNRLFMDTVVSISAEGVVPFLTIKSKDLITKHDLQKIEGKNASEKLSNILVSSKIGGIEEYIEFDKYIYFIYTQSRYVNTIIYDKETKKTDILKNFIDDLVCTKDAKNSMAPRFSYADSTALYGFLQSHNLEHFLELLKNGYISDMVKSNKDIEKITIDSNPIIFCYEYKK
jgi:hypothetical protein